MSAHQAKMPVYFPKILLQERVSDIFGVIYEDFADHKIKDIEFIAKGLSIMPDSIAEYTETRDMLKKERRLDIDPIVRPSGEVYKKLQETVIDSVVLDKEKVVRFLAKCGCSIRQEVQPLTHAYVQRILSSAATPPQSSGDTTTTPQRQKQQRPEITQREAATLVGVTERTIRNWDKGIKTPDGYPGRESQAALVMFAARRAQDECFRKEAQAVRKARPSGDMSEFSEEDL